MVPVSRVIGLVLVGLLSACTEPTAPDRSVEAPPLLAHLPTHHAYVAVDLSTLGGPSSAMFINDAGQVMGTSETSEGYERVFFWEDGVLQDIGTLGGSSATLAGPRPAKEFSSAGHIIGRSTLAGDEETHAFLWHEGVMIDLGGTDGAFGANWVNASGQVVADQFFASEQLWQNGSWGPVPMDRAIAINDAGVVAGMIGAETNPFGGGDQLGLWDGTTLSDLGSLTPDVRGFMIVYGINEAGQVIGRASTADPYLESAFTYQRGFLWDGASMIDLGSLGGTTSIRQSQPLDINELGQVVGSAENVADFGRAFLWSDGSMTELPLLAGDRSSANAINDAGQAVGWQITTGDLTTQRALLWEGGSVFLLGGLFGPRAIAQDINSDGWIVGTSYDASGLARATLWRPGTPVELAEGLLADLAALAELGDPALNALRVPIERALASLARGQDTATRNQLMAFQNQMGAFVNAGLLSELDEENLRGAVRAILVGMGS